MFKLYFAGHLLIVSWAVTVFYTDRFSIGIYTAVFYILSFIMNMLLPLNKHFKFFYCFFLSLSLFSLSRDLNSFSYELIALSAGYMIIMLESYRTVRDALHVKLGIFVMTVTPFMFLIKNIWL